MRLLIFSIILSCLLINLFKFRYFKTDSLPKKEINNFKNEMDALKEDIKARIYERNNLTKTTKYAETYEKDDPERFLYPHELRFDHLISENEIKEMSKREFLNHLKYKDKIHFWLFIQEDSRSSIYALQFNHTILNEDIIEIYEAIQKDKRKN